MKKLILISFLCFLLSCSLFVNNSQASVASDFFLTNIPENTLEPWRRLQFDKLAFDVVIPSNNGNEDSLNALSIMNLQSAYYKKGIEKLVLWSDDKTVGFQGMGIDNKIGDAIWDGSSSTWYWDNLSVVVPVEGLRIFVSVETENDIDDNRNVQLVIPKFTDNNSSGDFDFEDKGVFMSSGNNGPVDQELKNINMQSIRSGTRDTEGPKSVITNLFDGDEIELEDSFVMSGLSKDQGNRSVNFVQISIAKEGTDDNWKDISTDKYDFADWSYNWQPAEIGNYEIKIKSRDLGENESITEAITVTVKEPVKKISVENSIVEIVPASVLADGVSSALITVTAKDSDGNPVSGKTVSISSSRGINDTIATVSEISDANGIATFEIKSMNAGMANITAMIGDLTLIQMPVITFTETDIILPSEIINGDIIQCKTSSNPFAVYIVKTVGDTKYIRHIVSLEIFNYYGHLKWENLKQVDSLTNYSLSGWARVNTGPNGTPGPTDKVYEINGDQSKHWINMTAEDFLSHGGSESAIYTVNQGEMDLYTTGPDVMSL